MPFASYRAISDVAPMKRWALLLLGLAACSSTTTATTTTFATTTTTSLPSSTTTVTAAPTTAAVPAEAAIQLTEGAALHRSDNFPELTGAAVGHLRKSIRRNPVQLGSGGALIPRSTASSAHHDSKSAGTCHDGRRPTHCRAPFAMRAVQPFVVNRKTPDMFGVMTAGLQTSYASTVGEVSC